jgi:zinc D-Ala-D-Ala carboxypeptidase
MKCLQSSSSSVCRPLLLLLLGCVLLLTACSARGESSDSGEADVNPDALPGPAVEPFHPWFSFTRVEFDQLVAILPQASREPMSARPTSFLDLLVELRSEPEELTWLVDKSHHLAGEYEPSDLVELDDYPARLDVSRTGHRVRALILPDLFAMVDAARADGVTLLISSAYRSYEYQEGIYRYWFDELGQEEADRISARPGTSQHQLGTVIDFGCICDEFADTDAGRWLMANAARFGFSLSYPDGYEAVTGYAYESWHFRYIGKVAAQMENEFFAGVQQRLTEFMHTNLTVFLSFLIDI